MSENIFKGVTLVTLVLAVFGCASAKDIKVKTYLQERERVDQELQGTVGNWQNAPEAGVDSDRKETRKIYVVEFNKPAPQVPELEKFDLDESKLSPQTTSFKEPLRSATGRSYQNKKIQIPPLDDIQVDVKSADKKVKGSANYVEYTVQKDDTLQKISKKFYDSYSKWPKIYDANKTIIKNPDQVQPGLVIQIPMDE